MSMGIYIYPWVFNKCPWVFIICPWVFINVHGYLKMLVGIYQSEGIYQKLGDDTFQGVVLLHYSDSHVTVT